MTARAFSSGKLIISGEHSVVYGYPAFAVPVSLGLTVELTTDSSTSVEKPEALSPFLQHIQQVCEKYFKKKFAHIAVQISAQLPQNAGLGSSAALAQAYICAYMQLCDLKLNQAELLHLISECEKFAHTNPSGIDAAVIVHQQPIVFIKKNAEFSLTYKPTDFFPLDECMLLNSGAATESTREMVDQVSHHPKRDILLSQIGEVIKKLIQTLENQLEPWSILTENQRLLEELGVVGERAKKIIQAIEDSGGHAKVCGAGGIQTGSGVILAYNQDKQTLFRLINQYNWQYIN